MFTYLHICIFRRFTSWLAFLKYLTKRLVFWNPWFYPGLSLGEHSCSLFGIVISKWSENWNEVTSVCSLFHIYFPDNHAFIFFEVRTNPEILCLPWSKEANRNSSLSQMADVMRRMPTYVLQLILNGLIIPWCSKRILFLSIRHLLPEDILPVFLDISKSYIWLANSCALMAPKRMWRICGVW